MRSWIIFIAVWFVSVFISIVIVSFLVYYESNKIWRWNFARKPLPPWVLLLLLLAAFMAGIIWIATECNDKHETSKRKGWLFIAYFTGTFALVCILVSLCWRSSRKWPFLKRNPQEVIEAPTTATENSIERNFESLTRQSKDVDDQITTWNMNDGLALSEQNDILVLRDLSHPNSEYCLNLCDSAAPIIRRQRLKTHKALDVVLVHQMPAKRSKILTIQDGFTNDFQC